MTLEEEVAHLRVENQALREALGQALAHIEELEKQKTPLRLLSKPMRKSSCPKRKGSARDELLSTTCASHRPAQRP